MSFRPRLRGRQHGNRRGDQGDETAIMSII
jgi:hypothetical protein